MTPFAPQNAPKIVLAQHGVARMCDTLITLPHSHGKCETTGPRDPGWRKTLEVDMNSRSIQVCLQVFTIHFS